jgi:hypothetical protein
MLFTEFERLDPIEKLEATSLWTIGALYMHQKS